VPSLTVQIFPTFHERSSVSTGSPWLVALAVFGAGLCIFRLANRRECARCEFLPHGLPGDRSQLGKRGGRGGSVIGSTFGGAILATGLPLSIVFIAIAVPALIAGVTMFALDRYRAATEAGCGNHGDGIRDVIPA
jgi:AAHS family 4-hydroxybenzoate transporter-like MFS transporter